MTKLSELKGFESAPKKKDEAKLLKLHGDHRAYWFNACHDQFSALDVGVDEKSALELFGTLPNYEDSIPDEMWLKMREAVAYNDKEFFTKLMQLNVNMTHKECAQAIAKEAGKLLVLRKGE